jgi:hypothetical protein
LGAIALASRACAAFYLPNAEQDGYSYAETIALWSAKLSAGEFRLADLFGFWLPLFQFVAAIPNVWIDNPLVAGKMISSLCGATSCVLIFAITRDLTRSFVFAWIAFVLLLLNPLHLLYSAAAMTDVPFGCLVLASLWFVVRKRWTAAAVLGALAESVRLEGWTLVVLIPLLQFVAERKISLRSLSILLLPPLLWLGLSQLATGDPFAYFARRVQYQTSYLDFYPSRHGFAWPDILQDIEYLFIGANVFVFVAIIAAGGLSILHMVRRSPRFSWPALVLAACAAAILGFLVLGYVTKRQPVILPRYGLIFFLLGLPLFLWWLQMLTNAWKHPLSRVVVAVAIALLLWQWRPQLLTIAKVLPDFRVHREIATIVANALQQPNAADRRCFADAPSIHVLSRLPRERFVRSQTTPPAAAQNPTAFESYLREQHVAYLVYTSVEDSLPAKLYPQFGRANSDTGNFELVTVGFSPFGPDVWLYRLRN